MLEGYQVDLKTLFVLFLFYFCEEELGEMFSQPLSFKKQMHFFISAR